MSLICMSCGQSDPKRLKTMRTAKPCGHGGCSTCCTVGSTCFCRARITAVEHNQLAAQLDPSAAPDPPGLVRDDSGHVSCQAPVGLGSCREYSSGHCYSCNVFYCEEHEGTHDGHETVQILGYEPRATPIKCRKHGHPIRWFGSFERLYCLECVALRPDATHELEGCEDALRGFIEKVDLNTVHLIQQVNDCLRSVRELADENTARLRQHLQCKKKLSPGESRHYDLQLRSFVQGRIKTDAAIKVLEGELMGIEDRLLSLRAVAGLGSQPFIALALPYCASLLSAMGNEFTDIPVPVNGVSYSAEEMSFDTQLCAVPRGITGLCAMVLDIEKEVRKVRLLGFYTIMLNSGKVSVLDVRTNYWWGLTALDGRRVLDIAAHGMTAAFLTTTHIHAISHDDPDSTFSIEFRPEKQAARTIAMNDNSIYVARAGAIQRFSYRDGKITPGKRWKVPRSITHRVFCYKDVVVVLLKDGSVVWLDSALDPCRGLTDSETQLLKGVKGAEDFTYNAAGAAVYVVNGRGHFAHPCDPEEHLKFETKDAISMDISSIYSIIIITDTKDLEYATY